MVSVYPILSLLVIFALSLLVVRVGSVALRMTGLSPDVASFQATSAFSGAGYTTEEAERVVETPERRTVTKALIRLGSLGLVSTISSLVLSFTDAAGEELPNFVTIVAGVGGLVLLARSDWFNRLVTPVIEWGLRRTTDLDLRDYTRVLGLQREYRVAEVEVDAGDWLADESLADLDLPAEGVLVLGVRRGDTYIGAPRSDTEVRPGDVVVLYGKEDRLRELSDRESGDDRTREYAVADHERDLEVQDELVGEETESERQR
ncbi:TrkA C-terminal domain-containing protein [Halorussus salinus]|uniref:TrkA C-terminal domain-containing protein n=1 Tax=Halorussus salinus TaxID=1364935 RepID=UPI001091F0D6|nr:TrkA C-terminal domain-containing protein [Halorussus salinus]